jgi:hypothetical protein
MNNKLMLDETASFLHYMSEDERDFDIYCQIVERNRGKEFLAQMLARVELEFFERKLPDSREINFLWADFQHRKAKLGL